MEAISSRSVILQHKEVKGNNNEEWTHGSAGTVLKEYCLDGNMLLE